MALHIIDSGVRGSTAHSRGHVSTVGVVLSLVLGAAALAGIGTAALDAAQGATSHLGQTSLQTLDAADR